MNDKSKRRFMRFHLLTVIVMVFAAGAALWPNTRPHGEYILHYGWPWQACTWIGDPEVKEFYETAAPQRVHLDDLQWNKPGLLKDLLCVVAMTLLAGVVCEFLIRRPEALKP